MTVTQKTALQLKAAGFPTPEPAPGQFWYGKIYVGGSLEHTALLIFVKSPELFGSDSLQFANISPMYHSASRLGVGGEAYFAPTLDHITPYLPEGFALEIWDWFPSCTNRDDENPIRTTGENFAEAAAKMWLELASLRGYGAN